MVYNLSQGKRAKIKELWCIFYFIFSAKQLSDLEKMHSEKDREKSLISNLKKNAAIKGFIIQGNCGEGNCMFHALSRQLEIKLGLKISHGDLRREIVEYLENHRELVRETAQ